MNISHLRRFVLVFSLALVIVGSGSTAMATVDPAEESGGIASRTNLSDGTLLFDAVFVSGYVEIAAELIAPDAVIHTDRGDYVGPLGLLDYLDAAGWSDSDATLSRSDVEVVGDLVIIRWQAEHDSGIFHGQTLATVENGQFVSITVQDASSVSNPNAGNAAVVAAASSDSEVATGYPCPLFCDA